MTIADDEELAESARAPAWQLTTSTFLLAVAALTLLAAAAGYFAGLHILAGAKQTVLSKADDPPALLDELQRARGANIRVLAPIMTNLSGGSNIWMRLESSLVFREAVPADADALAARIAEDIVAFLRTLSAKDIEGGSGFQHLSEDLNDRVRVRSGGRAQELIIQGLIVE